MNQGAWGGRGIIAYARDLDMHKSMRYGPGQFGAGWAGCWELFDIKVNGLL